MSPPWTLDAFKKNKNSRGLREKLHTFKLKCPSLVPVDLCQQFIRHDFFFFFKPHPEKGHFKKTCGRFCEVPDKPLFSNLAFVLKKAIVPFNDLEEKMNTWAGEASHYVDRGRKMSSDRWRGRLNTNGPDRVVVLLFFFGYAQLFATTWGPPALVDQHTAK